MQIGIDTFVAGSGDTAVAGSKADVKRVQELLEEVELADRVGLDVFGIGEHHRPDFISSSPAVLLAAAAARTKNIRLSSAVTVLSSDDPVRIFQQFATLDLISQGRAEIIVGRGSFIESYPLFGFDLDDYDKLFTEKLELLLKIRGSIEVTWQGKHRPPLTGQGVYPRPMQNPLPIRIGVGGTPHSFVRAGALGLPLVVAIIGGEPHRFAPMIELYREAGRRAGHGADQLSVSIHSVGYIADTSGRAGDEFWPSYSQMFGKIGRERGWAPVVRPQFNSLCGPHGALMVGDPQAIAEKILYENQVLGGISRMTILMDGSLLSHQQIMHAIELLGTKVAPMVNARLAVG